MLIAAASVLGVRTQLLLPLLLGDDVGAHRYFWNSSRQAQSNHHRKDSDLLLYLARIPDIVSIDQCDKCAARASQTDT